MEFKPPLGRMYRTVCVSRAGAAGPGGAAARGSAGVATPFESEAGRIFGCIVWQSFDFSGRVFTGRPSGHGQSLLSRRPLGLTVAPCPQELLLDPTVGYRQALAQGRPRLPP